MSLGRLTVAVCLIAAVVAGVFGVRRWRESVRRDDLAGLKNALRSAEAYPRRLSGDHDAAVAEQERLTRAIEEVEQSSDAGRAEAQRTAAIQRQYRRIDTIVELRMRSKELEKELALPRPPGEDDDR